MAAPVQNVRRSGRPNAAAAVIVTACGLSLATTVLALAILPLGHSFAGSRDFAFYWATGRQLLHHGNPYNAQAMSALEHGAGFAGHGSYYMRNPPWALWLTLPAGLISARAAALPWALLLIATLVLALDSLWKTFGRPERPVDWLGYCFPPALICVAMGQLSVLLLLGLAWFLRFHRTRPYLAGAALWFCTLKPHVLLPFAAALLLWMVLERQWRVLSGAVAAIAASSALTELLDPGAWNQYWQWAHQSRISQEAVPCLSVALRAWVGRSHPWLDFVPSAVACLWAAAFYFNRRATWNWAKHGGLLVLISLVVAPYCWINDQCLAIAPLMYAAGRTRSQGKLAILGAMCLVAALQVFGAIPLDSWWYLWPAPAWLAWWIWARASPAPDPAAAPVAVLASE